MVQIRDDDKGKSTILTNYSDGNRIEYVTLTLNSLTRRARIITESYRNISLDCLNFNFISVGSLGYIDNLFQIVFY